MDGWLEYEYEDIAAEFGRFLENYRPWVPDVDDLPYPQHHILLSLLVLEGAKRREALSTLDDHAYKRCLALAEAMATCRLHICGFQRVSQEHKDLFSRVPRLPPEPPRKAQGLLSRIVGADKRIDAGQDRAIRASLAYGLKHVSEFELLNACAMEGLADAAFELGVAYRKGAFAPRVDLCESRRLLQQAVDHGHIEARWELADLLYELSDGVGPDYEKSLNLLDESVIFGFPDAQLTRGMALLNGEPDERNYLEALRLLRLAANAGNGWAAFEVARIYRDGLGVQSDDAVMAEFLVRSARLCHAEALAELVHLHSGGNPRFLSQEKADHWRQQLLCLEKRRSCVRRDNR